MKIVSFKCDYCSKMIDRDNEDVEILHRGKIGYMNNEILSNKDEDIYHFHPDCLEKFHSSCFLNLLTNINTKTEKEPDAEEADPEDLEYTPTKKEDSRKDLGKINALLNAGWTMKDIASELGVSMSCAYRWKKEAEEAYKAK